MHSIMTSNISNTDTSREGYSREVLSSINTGATEQLSSSENKTVISRYTQLLSYALNDELCFYDMDNVKKNGLCSWISGGWTTCLSC